MSAEAVNWAFQSMLYNKLNRDDEFNELKEKQEKEWAEAQMAEYEAKKCKVPIRIDSFKPFLLRFFIQPGERETGKGMGRGADGGI